MNVAILMGRLTRDPEVREKTREDGSEMITAMYTLAVDRRKSKDQDQQADFIQCVAFGKPAEFAQKYCHKGTKITVRGSIITGSYTDRDGRKVYTTQVRVDEQEFAESKKAQSGDGFEPAEDSPFG